MPKRKDSSVQDAIEDLKKRRKYHRKHAKPTVSDRIRALSSDAKGRQMIEDSPTYMIKDGKEKLVKSRTGPRKSVSFSIPKQEWKEKKK